MSKRRSKLEIFMRKIGDLCNVNFRFHKLQLNPKGRGHHTRRWDFEWWKRVPGNPLNKDHIMRYNNEWPISSFQSCKRRKQYAELHPELKNYCDKWPDDGKLSISDLHVCDLSGLDSSASKDEAIEYVLFHTSFLKDALGYSASSYEQLMCELELNRIGYEQLD